MANNVIMFNKKATTDALTPHLYQAIQIDCDQAEAPPHPAPSQKTFFGQMLLPELTQNIRVWP